MGFWPFKLLSLTLGTGLLQLSTYDRLLKSLVCVLFGENSIKACPSTFIERIKTRLLKSRFQELTLILKEVFKAKKWIYGWNSNSINRFAACRFIKILVLWHLVIGAEMTFLSGALIASVMTLGTGKSWKFPSSQIRHSWASRTQSTANDLKGPFLCETSSCQKNLRFASVKVDEFFTES